MKSLMLLILFLSVFNYFIEASYPRYSGGGYASEGQPSYSNWRAEPNYPPAPNQGPTFQLHQSESHYVPPQIRSRYAHNQPDSSHLPQDPNYAQNQYEDNYGVPIQQNPDIGVIQPELNYAPLNQDISVSAQQQEKIFAQRHHEMNPEHEFLFAKSRIDANYAESQPQNDSPQRYPEPLPYLTLPEKSHEGYPVVPRQQTWPQRQRLAMNHAFNGDRYQPQAKDWSPNSYIPNESISQGQYPSPAEPYTWRSNRYQHVSPPLQDDYHGRSYEKQAYNPMAKYPQAVPPSQSIQHLQVIQKPVYQPLAVQQSQHIRQLEPNQQPQSIQRLQPLEKQQYEKFEQLPPQAQAETEIAENTGNTGNQNNAETASKIQVKELVTQKKRFILMYPNGTTEQVDVLEDILTGKANLFKSGDIYTEKDIKQKLRITNSDHRDIHQSEENQNKNINDNFYQNRPQYETPQNKASIVLVPKRNMHIETTRSDYATPDNVDPNKKIYKPRYRYHDTGNNINHENNSPTVKTTENFNSHNLAIRPSSAPSDNLYHEIHKKLPKFPSIEQQNYRKPNESQSPNKNLTVTVSKDDKNVSHDLFIENNNNQDPKPKYAHPIKPIVENYQFSSTYKTTDPDTYNQRSNLDTQPTFNQNKENRFAVAATTNASTWKQNSTAINKNITTDILTTIANNTDEPYNHKPLDSPYQRDEITNKQNATLVSHKNDIKIINNNTSSTVPPLNTGYEYNTTEESTDASAWVPHTNNENTESADYSNEDFQVIVDELSYYSENDYFYTTESDNIAALSPAVKTNITNIVDYNTTDDVAANTTSHIDVLADSKNNHTTAQPLEYEDDGSEIVKDLGTLNSNDTLPFWIGTDDELWAKALEENNNTIYVFNVNIRPTVEKHTKIYVFENGTTVEETSETVLDFKDDQLPKELKITMVVRNPKTDDLDANEEEKPKNNP